MNLEQLRAKLAQIAQEMEAFGTIDNLTAEDMVKADTLAEEFESIKKQIETKERIERVAAAATASAGRRTSPETSPVVAPRVEVSPSRNERMGGFKSFGEYLLAVRASSLPGGKIDPRFSNTMFERNGEDGGFLVPEEMIPDVAKKLQSDDSLLARTKQFQVGGNSLSLIVDETAPWSGGVLAYWTAEGASNTESGHKFKEASWKLHKLSALVKVTDELMEDTVGLESYVSSAAGDAIVNQVNKAIISGSGVGKPRGILGSAFKYKVSKESGQAADTVVAKNIINMYSRLLPASRARAVWICNAQVEPQLRTMKDDLGNFIYLSPGSQMNQTPYGNLLGLPVVSMIGAMPALGDEGDIVLVDLQYYYTILKAGGIKSSASQHLYFDKDIQAFKFTMRVDGACPYQSPVTTENGSYQLSAFVTLEDR